MAKTAYNPTKPRVTLEIISNIYPLFSNQFATASIFINCGIDGKIAANEPSNKTGVKTTIPFFNEFKWG